MSATLDTNLPSAVPFLFDVEQQGRIYVANEYPTFAKTMSMVSQKLTFSRSNYLQCKTKSVCFDEKHANFRVKHINT